MVANPPNADSGDQYSAIGDNISLAKNAKAAEEIQNNDVHEPLRSSRSLRDMQPFHHPRSSAVPPFQLSNQPMNLFSNR
jgi:hypothetical protein